MSHRDLNAKGKRRKQTKSPTRRSYLGDGETEGWVAHRLEMIISEAWRRRPISLAKFLERLEIEHMRHGGQHNGNLNVSYNQFELYGIAKRNIRATIELGVDLGFVEVFQSDEWEGNIRGPNSYRLTYLPEPHQRAPTDEWSYISKEKVEEHLRRFRIATTRKKLNNA